MFGDKESNFFMKFNCIPQFLLLGVAQIFVGSKSVMFVCQMSQGLLCAYPFAYVVVISFPCKLDSPSSSIPLSVMLSNKVGFTFGPNPSFWALKPGDGYNIFTGFRA